MPAFLKLAPLEKTSKLKMDLSAGMVLFVIVKDKNMSSALLTDSNYLAPMLS